MAMLNRQCSIGILSWIASIGVHTLLGISLIGTQPLATIPNQQLVRPQHIMIKVDAQPPPLADQHTKPHTDQKIESSSTPNIAISPKHHAIAITPPIAPNYLNNPPPVYPLRARKNHHQGTVILDIRVSSTGKATQIKILKSSGHKSLDQSAKRSVMTWTFISARKNNTPVEGHIEIPITFKLENQTSSG